MNAGHPTRVRELYRWCRGEGPAPSYLELGDMLDDHQRFLELNGARPCAYGAEAWTRLVHGAVPVGGDFLVCVSIGWEYGERHETLRSWWQWQHPRFFWTPRPYPAAKLLELTKAAGSA